MGLARQETHRPGVFKRPNKSHKTGRHRSKGSISSDSKGRLTIFNYKKEVFDEYASVPNYELFGRLLIIQD